MENSSLYGLFDTLRTNKNNKHDRKSNNPSIIID